MSAPAFVSIGTGISSTATLTVDAPGSVSPGNLLVAVIATVNITVATPPSGWTLVASVTNVGRKLYLYWRLAAGGDPVSFDWGMSGSDRSTGHILQYSGNHATTPIDDADTTSAGSTPDPAPAAISSTAGSDRKVIRAVVVRGDFTVTVPAGTTQRGNTTSFISSAGVTLATCDADQASAGATSAADFDLSGSGANSYATMTFTIAPVASGGGMRSVIAMGGEGWNVIGMGV